MASQEASAALNAYEQFDAVETSGRPRSSSETEPSNSRLSMLLSPGRKFTPGDVETDPFMKLRQAALTFRETPAILKHPSSEVDEYSRRLELAVPDWSHVKRGKHTFGVRRDLRDALCNIVSRSGETLSRQAVQKTSKVAKAKTHNIGGRTYTSKFRGVHQTFPTKRWEAQFRRSGKPTSLGCFDEEEEAARAYDKMMIWCELHHSSGIKAGITNFDMSEYEKDIPILSTISQDELVQALRSDGRRQAAQRILRQKRDGQLLHMSSSGYITP